MLTSEPGSNGMMAAVLVSYNCTSATLAAHHRDPWCWDAKQIAAGAFVGVSCAPGRTRTCDARFRKPTLYPLSYGGGAEDRPTVGLWPVRV